MQKVIQKEQKRPLQKEEKGATPSELVKEYTPYELDKEARKDKLDRVLEKLEKQIIPDAPHSPKFAKEQKLSLKDLGDVSTILDKLETSEGEAEFETPEEMEMEQYVKDIPERSSVEVRGDLNENIRTNEMDQIKDDSKKDYIPKYFDELTTTATEVVDKSPEYEKEPDKFPLKQRLMELKIPDKSRKISEKEILDKSDIGKESDSYHHEEEMKADQNGDTKLMKKIKLKEDKELPFKAVPDIVDKAHLAKRPDHRCAALIHQAQIRCTAQAAVSGGVVLLPETSIWIDKDNIPRGYLPGEILPNIVTPQILSTEPDWARPSQNDEMKKCRAACALRRIANDKFATDEHADETIKEKRYVPKLVLTWEDFDEILEKEGTTGSIKKPEQLEEAIDDPELKIVSSVSILSPTVVLNDTIIGRRLSRVLSGDATGFSLVPTLPLVPYNMNVPKTLSGEILQRRISDIVLESLSSEMISVPPFDKNIIDKISGDLIPTQISEESVECLSLTITPVATKSNASEPEEEIVEKFTYSERMPKLLSFDQDVSRTVETNLENNDTAKNESVNIYSESQDISENSLYKNDSNEDQKTDIDSKTEENILLIPTNSIIIGPTENEEKIFDSTDTNFDEKPFEILEPISDNFDVGSIDELVIIPADVELSNKDEIIFDEELRETFLDTSDVTPVKELEPITAQISSTEEYIFYEPDETNEIKLSEFIHNEGILKENDKMSTNNKAVDDTHMLFDDRLLPEANVMLNEVDMDYIPRATTASDTELSAFHLEQKIFETRRSLSILPISNIQLESLENKQIPRVAQMGGEAGIDETVTKTVQTIHKKETVKKSIQTTSRQDLPIRKPIQQIAIQSPSIRTVPRAVLPTTEMIVSTPVTEHRNVFEVDRGTQHTRNEETVLLQTLDIYKKDHEIGTDDDKFRGVYNSKSVRNIDKICKAKCALKANEPEDSKKKNITSEVNIVGGREETVSLQTLDIYKKDQEIGIDDERFRGMYDSKNVRNIGKICKAKCALQSFEPEDSKEKNITSEVNIVGGREETVSLQTLDIYKKDQEIGIDDERFRGMYDSKNVRNIGNICKAKCALQSFEPEDSKEKNITSEVNIVGGREEKVSLQTLDIYKKDQEIGIDDERFRGMYDSKNVRNIGNICKAKCALQSFEPEDSKEKNITSEVNIVGGRDTHKQTCMGKCTIKSTEKKISYQGRISDTSETLTVPKSDYYSKMDGTFEDASHRRLPVKSKYSSSNFNQAIEENDEQRIHAQTNPVILRNLTDRDTHICPPVCTKMIVTESVDDIPPSLIIQMDEEIIALRNALAVKESYCSEQRKIAASALEQLENIKNIVEERDDLRKKLENSQCELEELKRNIALGKPCGIEADTDKYIQTPQSKPTIYIPFDEIKPTTTEPKSCEEEIRRLEREIEDIRSGKLTPDLEAKVIRKEVEVLKKYCSKLSVIQKENQELKWKISQYEEKINFLGLANDDDAGLEELQKKLYNLDETMRERDSLKMRVRQLEEELYNYKDLPEDIEVFKQRSILLDEVLQDRDRLSKRLEELRGVDDEVNKLRKKSSRVDELELKLNYITKEKKSTEEEIEQFRCRCSYAEIEALNQKAEGDTLRSKIVCLEHEVESLKCMCKEKELLRKERDHLKNNLDELVRMQNDFDYMRTQMKCFDVLRAERDMFKAKYDNIIGLECECDILRSQVEKAKCIEKERDALENQVEDLETCIADQENEIRRLVCHIDLLAKGRDDQQEKLKMLLGSMRAELEKKDAIILSSEEKLSTVQVELRNSIEGLSYETTNLRNRNEILEKELFDAKQYIENITNEVGNSDETIESLNNKIDNLEKVNEALRHDKNDLEKANENLKLKISNETRNNNALVSSLKERENSIRNLQEILKEHESVLNNFEISTTAQNEPNDTSEIDLLKNELTVAKEENRKLQWAVTEMSTLTGDEHLQELLRQSKCAVQKIAIELNKQYNEWDCMKNNLKEKPDMLDNVSQTEAKLPIDHASVETEYCNKIDCTTKVSITELEDDWVQSDYIVPNEDCNKLICMKGEIIKADKKQADTGLEEEIEEEMLTARSTDDGRIKYLEERIELLEKELVQTNETILNLQDRLALSGRVTAENVALRRHSSEIQEVAKDQIKELIEHLKKAKERVAQLEEENGKLIQQSHEIKLGNEKLLLLVDELQHKSKQYDIESFVGMESFLNLKKDLETCLEEKANLFKHMTLLESQLSKGTSTDKQLFNLTIANQELKDMIKKLENDSADLNAKLHDEMVSRKNVENEVEKLQQRILSLQKELSEKYPDGNRLIEMEQNLHNEINLRQNAEDKLRNLEEELNKQKTFRQKAEDKIKELEKILAQQLKAGDTNELDNLRKEIDNLKSENVRLNNLLTNLKVDLDDNLKKLQEEQQLHQKAEERNEDIQKEIKLLQDQLSNIISGDQLDEKDTYKKLNKLEDELKEEQRRRKIAEDKIMEIEKLTAQQSIAGDTNEFDNLRKERDTLKNGIEHLSGVVENLKGNLAKEKLMCEEKSNALLSEIDNLKKQLEIRKGVEAEIEKLKIEKDDLNKMLASNIVTTSRRSSKLEMELRDLNDGKEDLMDEINKLRVRNKFLESDNKDLKTKLEALADENKQLNIDLNKIKSESEKLKALQPELNLTASLKKENENLMRKIESQANEISELINKLKKPASVVQITKSELEKEIKEKDTLQSIVDDLENQLKNIVKDDRKTNVITPSDELQKIMADLTKRLEEEHERAEAAEIAWKNLKASDPTAMLNNEIEKLKQKISHLENDKGKIIQQNDEVTKLKKELDSAQNELKKLTADKELLKTSLSDKQKENQELNSLLDKLKKGASGGELLKDEITKFQNLLSVSENEKFDLKNDLNQRDNELKKVYDKLSKLQNENGELKQDIVKLQNENDKLKKDLENTLNNVTKTSEKNAQLEKANSKLLQTTKNLETDLEKVKKDLDATLDTAKRGSLNVSELQGELSALKQIISKLETENSKLKYDLDDALKKYNNTTAKESQLLDENKKLKSINNDAEKTIASMNKEIESLLADSKKASTNLIVQQTETSNLRDKLAKMEVDNAKLKTELDFALEKAQRKTPIQVDDPKLIQKLSDLENANSKLKKQLDEAKRIIAVDKPKEGDTELKETITKFENENAQLNKDLKSALEELNKVKSRIDQIQEDDIKLKKRLTAQEMENSKLKNELNNALDEARRAAGDISQMRDDESRLKQRIALLEGEASKLKKALDSSSISANANLDQLKDENSQLKQKNLLLENENEKLKKVPVGATKDMLPDETNSLKQKLLQFVNENGKLKKDLDEHKNCPNLILQLKDNLEKFKKKISDLETDNLVLKNKYDGAMGDMKQSVLELAHCKESEANLKKEILDLQNNNNKLNKNINTLMADIKSYTTGIDSMKDAEANLKETLALLDIENLKLKNDLDTALKDLKKFQKSNDQLKDTETKLKQKLAQLENENVTLKKDLDYSLSEAKKGNADALQMKGEGAKLKERIIELENETVKLKNALNNALEKDRKSLADISKMRNDSGELNIKLANLENENVRLKKDLEKSLKDVQAGSAEKDVLKEENNKLKQRLAQLEKEVTKLKNDLNFSLEEAKKGAKEIAQIQTEDAKLKQRILELEKENSNLRTDLDSAIIKAKGNSNTITQLKNESMKKKQIISQLENEIAKLKKDLNSTLKDFKKGDSMQESLQDENDNLKQKLEQLEKEKANLKENLESSLSEEKSRATENSQTIIENKKLKQIIKQLENQIEKLKKDLNLALNEQKMTNDNASKLREQIAEMENINKKLQKDLNLASGELKKYDITIGKVKGENISKEQRLTQLETDNLKLKNELDSILSDANSRTADVKRLKEENTMLKQKIAKLESENTKMKQEIDIVRADNKTAKNDLKEASKIKKDNLEQASQLKELKKQLENITSDSYEKERKIIQLNEEIDKLKQNISELSSQIKKNLEKAKTDLKGKDTTIAALDDENAKLKQKLLVSDNKIQELNTDLKTAKDAANKNVAELSKVKNEVENLKQITADQLNQIRDLEKTLEKVTSASKEKDRKIVQLNEELAKLKQKLNDYENQIKQLNNNLKTAKDTANKSAADLIKLKDEFVKARQQYENNFAKMKGDSSGVVMGYQNKLKELNADLAKQKKECSDSIASMKEQFDRDIKNLLKKNDDSIATLQRAHEELLRDLNEKHDKELNSLHDALRKAKEEAEAALNEKDKHKKMLEDQRKKSLEIKTKVEQVESVISNERRKSKDEKRKNRILEEKLEEVQNEMKEEKKKSVDLAQERDDIKRESLLMKEKLKEQLRGTESLPKDKLSDVPLTPNDKEMSMVGKPLKKLTMTTFRTASLDSKFPDVIAITAPLSDKELKFFGKQTCSCATNLETVLNNLAKNGLESLSIEELQLLHTKICDATANVLEKLGQTSGVLSPNENSKLALMRKIASLEGDLMKKQKHAQQKVLAMQYAVKLEKERLSDLRKNLDEEKEKNSELLSQIGSQSKVVSNIEEERDLIQRQKSYHEHKLEQFIVSVEEERAKSRNLEDELEKEKTNNRHLKSLLDAERDRARQNKRKDTETLETMRIKLEKTLNSEMMLRMKLQEKSRRRAASPSFTPVKDTNNQYTPSSRSKAPAFYTDLTPGDGNQTRACTCTRKSVSSPSRTLSSSSNGLDSEDK